MAKFGRIVWNNNDFINVFYNFGIYRNPKLITEIQIYIKFTMMCVNLDRYTVK